jgi:hypothetical protein
LNEHEHTGEKTTVHINYLEPFKVDKSDKNWYKNLQERMQQEIDKEEKLGRLR